MNTIKERIAETETNIADVPMGEPISYEIGQWPEVVVNRQITDNADAFTDDPEEQSEQEKQIEYLRFEGWSDAGARQVLGIADFDDSAEGAAKILAGANPVDIVTGQVEGKHEL